MSKPSKRKKDVLLDQLHISVYAKDSATPKNRDDALRALNSPRMRDALLAIVRAFLLPGFNDRFDIEISS